MGQNISTQKTTHPIESNILNEKDGKIALQKAEMIDKYTTYCKNSWANKKARHNFLYDVHPHISEADQLKIREAIPKWIAPVNIVVLNNTADNGYPHTRPNIICIAQHNIDSHTLESILIHESVHMLQRRYPKIWDSIYENVLNMKTTNEQIPHELAAYVRYNPDTIYTPNYIWNDKWIPVPVYLRKDNPQLGDIRVNFYNVTTQKWQAYPPIEWTKFFGEMNNSEQEHPHETAAYCIQKYMEKKELKAYENELIKQVRIYFPELKL
jgi:hypothetical protein